MPHVTEEEAKENDSTSSISFLNVIATWWRKFHFSGRVIACSVLLGLGLILIGGLIFAINISDSNDTPNDSDSSISTKAPSNYTGPVVMGIGGFIVTTGVIMCLFETQVCRKKTGDSRPLISEKTDDSEKKSVDPESGPSTSHGHRSLKHSSNKPGSSPRKSKSRHAKSRSKERNQKSPTSKSPSVPIQASKSFMTSSEDNFLTPPNTLDENAAVVKVEKSGNSEIKHSAIMKSFTSSDPSWNQSTEFLTPSASFRDTSVSLNSSVEIDENNDVKNLTSTEMSEEQNISPEYMTPLTVEEDRIQQLLIRVKNEQKQMAESKKKTNVGTPELSERVEDPDSSQIQNKNRNDVRDQEEKTKTENSSTNPLSKSNSTMVDVNQKLSAQMGYANSDEQGQNNFETNVSERNLDVVHDKAVCEISDEVGNIAEEKNSSQSSSASLTNESKYITSIIESDKGVSHDSVHGNNGKVDLDSSVSSDETVVSPDSFQENAINTLSSNESSNTATLKENSVDGSKCLSSISVSSDNKSTVDIDVDHYDIQDKNLQQDINECHDLINNKDVKIEIHEMKSESKDKAS